MSSRRREQIPETVERRNLDGREDLREQFIVTIDPDDARDFDDAINVERMNGGGWKLGVHIADVAAYVDSRRARWIAKRSSAATAFICPIASSRCCPSA